MDGMDMEDLMFTLDKGVRFIPAKRCLVASGGSIITLSENSYRFLLLLLKGETDKQSLINQVWFEQRGSVSESSYYGQLYLLRKAFSLAGLPHSLIRTIPKKGVKYVGYVASESFHETAHSIIDGDNTVISVEDTAVLAINDEEASLEITKNNAELGNIKAVVSSWSQNRSWNIFVSTLAVLAVCWLTTLIFAIFFLLKR